MIRCAHIVMYLCLPNVKAKVLAAGISLLLNVLIAGTKYYLRSVDITDNKNVIVKTA